MPGLYYDQFHVGQVFKHPIRRTITEADNVWFSAVTHNPSYLHLDEEYCRTETEFGQRLVNSCFTLSLMVGISVGDTVLGTAVANLGWDEVRFPKPLFHGDTVRVESEVRGDAREQVPARRWHRHLRPPRLQPERRAGGPLQTLVPDEEDTGVIGSVQPLRQAETTRPFRAVAT